VTSLPKTFIGYSSDLPRATLDLNFAGNKSLTDNITSTNLVTFTRASSGTYVAANGFITQAVVNVLLWSESFEQSGWSTTGATITPKSAVGPTGELSASKLVSNAGVSGRKFVYQYCTVTAQKYTYSVYLKAGEFTTATLWFDTTAIVEGSYYPAYILINLATGVSSNPAIVSMTPVGNGWYRCVASATFTTGGVYPIALSIGAPNGGDYVGDGVSGIYIWGAQLETGSTANEYIRTTSVINSAPRFHHNPVTGESLGLLVEEQRTNLLLYSACDSNWITGGFGTATYNLGLSALGIFSGVSVASGGQSWHTLYRSGINLTVSTVYSFTLFYRAGTSGRCRIVFRNNGIASETIINGAVGNLSVTEAFAGSATVLSQYLCSDGLTYVVTGTFTPNATNTDYWFRIGPDSVSSGQTVIALGGQIEAGAFPTSYIPTTTATVTRSADLASITGTNFSSWYRQDEGTVFAEWNSSFVVVNKYPSVIAFRKSIADNSQNTFEIFATTGGANAQSNNLVRINNINELSSTTTLSGYPRIRAAAAVKSGDQGGATNGLVSGASNGTFAITLDKANIGNNGVNDLFNGTIRRLTYWPTRLPNTSLQEMTK